MDSQDKINVGASSSLVELKAELIKKQNELRQQKLAGKGVPKSASVSRVKAQQNLQLKQKRNAGVERRNAADLEQLELEQMSEEKSRAVLEAKAKLYEKMSAEALDYDEVEHPVLANSLVNFQQKAIEKYHAQKKGKVEEKDDWVEFIDTLGRTRRCHKSELAQAIANDEELARVEKERLETSEFPFSSEISSEGKSSAGSYATVPPPTTLNLTKTLTEEEVKEMAHRKWAAEQEKAEEKDTVHYQDVMYDEVRTHGVAYFGFASDSAKRADQIRELKTLSEQTKAMREKVGKERDQKASQLKERLKSVRARKRARLGLPPKKEEEDSSTSETTTTIDGTDRTSLGNSDEESGESKERKTVEMRPWDFGKPGVYGPKPVNFDQLDATWLRERRDDRKGDFAPPTTYYTKTKLEPQTSTGKSTFGVYNYPGFVKGGTMGSSSAGKGKTGLGMGRKAQYAETEGGESGSINQESWDEGAISSASTRVKAAAQRPVPIKDECVPSPELKKRRGESSSGSYTATFSKGRGVEIAPPPTFEYYHGESKGAPSAGTVRVGSMEDSISAGLRAMREQVEMRQKTGSETKGDGPAGSDSS